MAGTDDYCASRGGDQWLRASASGGKYIGGRGLAIKVLMDGMDPRAEALSPENLLIFATGPLTSTPAPTGNRYMVVTKSPLTGALSNSNSGGVFPTMMKRSGYD
ncbi:aldehyde ferredoxin oxidoreductase N-terminal domain-containing protein, partial [Chloroflexota bacterium]